MSSVEFAEIENIIVVQVDEFFFVAFENPNLFGTSKDASSSKYETPASSS